jgi:hypothetical protein
MATKGAGRERPAPPARPPLALAPRRGQSHSRGTRTHWEFAFCAACHTHLGWAFHGEGLFFGLLLDRLSTPS